MKKLDGVYPILNTTFHEDGSLDLASQARLVQYLLESGAHGLGLFGNASEGYALHSSEREEILKLVCKEVNGRVPLVVSSGHTGTDAAVELSREAEADGADALMVLPPYYLKTDGDGAEAWRVFTRALPLIRFELQPGMGVSAMKHNLVAAGVIRSARVRHPTASLDTRSLKELEFLRSWAGR